MTLEVRLDLDTDALHLWSESSLRQVRVPVEVAENLIRWTNSPLCDLKLSTPVCAVARHAVAAILRTAKENITRVTPLIIILTPTKVPIAQTELEGHRR